MKYTHNESIIMTKKVCFEGFAVTYRLFEGECGCRTCYSALISLSSSEREEDYFIPNLAESRAISAALFAKLCENTVLPCEVEAIYSDGFTENL